MRIASCSDVHLGPSPRRDRFRHDEEALLRFSDHLRNDHDQVVLAGDIFQADWGTALGPSPAEVHAVLARYPRLWSAWSGAGFVLLSGNHDRASREAIGARESFHVSADGVRIHYEHGDAHDPTCHGFGPNATMWTVGRLRASGMHRLSNWIEDAILQRLNDLLNAGDPICRRAERIAQATNSDVVIAGHTHWPRCTRVGRVVYANSGASVPSHLTYVSVDTARGMVEVKKFDEREGSTTTLASLEIAPQ